MLNNSFIPILIIIFSLLIIFYLLNVKNYNVYKDYIQKFDIVNKNNWIVLLTTNVYPNNTKNNGIKYTNTEINERKKLYIKQIKQWLDKTNLPIFVVDNSGYTFSEITDKKLKVISFVSKNKDENNDDNSYKSKEEFESIIYAINQLKDSSIYNQSSHILKVSGEFFLENIENSLNNSNQYLDLYLQKNRKNDIKWQPAEYFGIKKELLLLMIYKTLNKKPVENNLFLFSINKKYTFIENNLQ
jgi:hypothetical protein